MINMDHLQQTLDAVRRQLSEPSPTLKREINEALADVNAHPRDEAKEQILRELLRQVPKANEKFEID